MVYNLANIVPTIVNIKYVKYPELVVKSFSGGLAEPDMG